MKYIILTFVFFGFCNISSIAQQSKKSVILSHKRKTVEIIPRTGALWIGLKTKSDTIEYYKDKDLSYQLDSVNSDSIYVSKPSQFFYHVEKALRKGYSNGNVGSNSRFIKSFRKKGDEYHVYAIVLKYTKKAFAFGDISTITYPPKGSETTGCIFCFVPPIIVFYYFQMKKRTKPKCYDLKKWDIKVQ